VEAWNLALSTLLFADSDARTEAAVRLERTLVVDGVVSTDAPAIVPRLIEHLRDGAAPWKDLVLQLLVRLAFAEGMRTWCSDPTAWGRMHIQQ
jgi:hypothetical protein